MNIQDKRTYEVLENYDDLFYLADHYKWFKELLITQPTNSHLLKCIEICERKLNTPEGNLIRKAGLL